MTHLRPRRRRSPRARLHDPRSHRRLPSGPDLLGVLADVPFLCHIRRAVDLSDREPHTEITTYLSVHRAHVSAAFRTLSYLDGVNFARRANAPALFSVASMDPICPPSTVYAA